MLVFVSLQLRMIKCDLRASCIGVISEGAMELFWEAVSNHCTVTLICGNIYLMSRKFDFCI